MDIISLILLSLSFPIYGGFIHYKRDFFKKVKEDLNKDTNETVVEKSSESVPSTTKPKLKVTNDSRLKSIYQTLIAGLGTNLSYKGQSYKIDGFGDIVTLSRISTNKVEKPFLVLCVKDDKCWYDTTMSESQLNEFLSETKPKPKKIVSSLSVTGVPDRIEDLKQALYHFAYHNRGQTVYYNSHIFYVDDSLFYSDYGNLTIRHRESSRVYCLIEKRRGREIVITTNASIQDLTDFLQGAKEQSPYNHQRVNSSLSRLYHLLKVNHGRTFLYRSQYYVIVHYEDENCSKLYRNNSINFCIQELNPGYRSWSQGMSPEVDPEQLLAELEKYLNSKLAHSDHSTWMSLYHRLGTYINIRDYQLTFRFEKFDGYEFLTVLKDNSPIYTIRRKEYNNTLKYAVIKNTYNLSDIINAINGDVYLN